MATDAGEAPQPFSIAFAPARLHFAFAAMNVFAIDHPLKSQPSAFVHRLQRRLLIGGAVYIAYLLSLGPVCALSGRGYLGFVPQPLSSVVMAPAWPIIVTPGMRQLFRDYLDWWYHAPCDPYSSPAWQ